MHPLDDNHLFKGPKDLTVYKGPVLMVDIVKLGSNFGSFPIYGARF